MICDNCKNNIPDDSTFCPFCGKNVPKTPEVVKPDRKVPIVPIIVGGGVLLVAAAMVVILLITQNNKGGMPPSYAGETATRAEQAVQTTEQTSMAVISNETEPEDNMGAQTEAAQTDAAQTEAAQTEPEAGQDRQLESESFTEAQLQSTAEAVTEAVTEPPVQTTAEQAEIVTEEVTKKSTGGSIPAETLTDLVRGSDVVTYINGFHKVYTTFELVQRGTVTYGASDISCVENEDVEVLGVDAGSQGYAIFIRYSTGGGKHAEGYIPMDIVSNVKGPLESGISSGSFLISLTREGDFTEDHMVAAGDEVYYISDEGGGIFCVMYSLDAGGYRIAYCHESDYNKYVK